MWHPSVSVKITHKSLLLVTCEVTLPGFPVFIVSFVYASNYHEDRKALWELMANQRASQHVDGKPWIVLWDFNQTVYPHEHSTNLKSGVDKRTRAFRQCILDAELSDLNFRRNSFTWWNKSKTLPIAKKLN